MRRSAAPLADRPVPNRTSISGRIPHTAFHDSGTTTRSKRLLLVDDLLRPLALLEVDGVEVMPFASVAWDFADAEGEGFTSIDDWRSGHLRLWQAAGAQVWLWSRHKPAGSWLSERTRECSVLPRGSSAIAREPIPLAEDHEQGRRQISADMKCGVTCTTAAIRTDRTSAIAPALSARNCHADRRS